MTNESDPLPSSIIAILERYVSSTSGQRRENVRVSRDIVGAWPGSGEHYFYIPLDINQSHGPSVTASLGNVRLTPSQKEKRSLQITS